MPPYLQKQSGLFMYMCYEKYDMQLKWLKLDYRLL